MAGGGKVCECSWFNFSLLVIPIAAAGRKIGCTVKVFQSDMSLWPRNLP